MMFLLAGGQQILLQVRVVLGCVNLINSIQNVRVFPGQQANYIINAENMR